MRPHAPNPFMLNAPLIKIRQPNVQTGVLGQSPASQLLQGGAQAGIVPINVAPQAPGGAQAEIGLRNVARQAPDPRMQMDKIYRQNLLYMLRLQQRFQYNYRKQQHSIERARLDLKEQLNVARKQIASTKKKQREKENSEMTMGEWLHAQNVGSDPRESDPIAIEQSNKIRKKITIKPFTLGTHHQIWDDTELQAKLRHWRDDNLEYVKDYKMLQSNNLLEKFISNTSEETKEQQYSKEEFMKDREKINVELRKANSKFSVPAKKLPATGELYDLGTMLAYDVLLLQKEDNTIKEEEFQELVAEIHSPKRFQRKKKFSQLTSDVDDGKEQTTRRSKRQRKEVCYTDDYSFSFEDEIKL